MIVRPNVPGGVLSKKCCIGALVRANKEAPQCRLPTHLRHLRPAQRTIADEDREGSTDVDGPRRFGAKAQTCQKWQNGRKSFVQMALFDES